MEMAKASASRARPLIRKKLSECDAWTIALAWRDQLQGCVRLEINHSDDTNGASPRFVPVFSYVSFVLNGSFTDGLREIKDAKDTATAARAATLAWFALSCCAGFSAHENPHFWRRVFSELHAVVAQPSTHRKTASSTKKPHPYRPQRPISDAVRFCRGEYGGCFPCVRFVAKYPQDSGSVRAFLVASEVVDRKLLKSLKRLAPFIRPAAWTSRSIGVAVEGLDIEELIKVLKNLLEINPSPILLQPSLQSPVFQLDTVILRRQDTRSTLAIQDLKTLSDARIVLEECEFSHLFHTQRGPIESLLNPPHGKSLISIDTLLLARSIGSRTKFGVACSSLPLLPLLQAVDLTSKRFEVKAMGVDEWAWLGYAVFHPDATETVPSFTQLTLRLPYVRDVAEHIQAFKSMAMGNNLLCALGYEVLTSSTYYKARLQAGSRVRLESPDSEGVEIDMLSESWCTLFVASPDRSRLDDWTHAVVPGHGIGYIRREDVVAITPMPPGRSCVRHLRLELPDIVNDHGALVPWVLTPMLDLLSVLGPDLLSLDMAESLSMDTPTIRAILERCPLLHTLRVSHDGGFWSSAVSDLSFPRLEALELCVDATAGHAPGLTPLCSSSLSDLKMLRIKTLQHESFDVTHKHFLQALATYPGILHGHWCYAGVAQFQTYEKRRLHSLSLQRRMDCGQSDVSQVPMRLDGKLAFLSVVRDTSMKASMLSGFGQDVVRTVFGFSTSPEPRTVYIGRD